MQSHVFLYTVVHKKRNHQQKYLNTRSVFTFNIKNTTSIDNDDICYEKLGSWHISLLTVSRYYLTPLTYWALSLRSRKKPSPHPKKPVNSMFWVCSTVSDFYQCLRSAYIILGIRIHVRIRLHLDPDPGRTKLNTKSCQQEPYSKKSFQIIWQISRS